MLRQIQLRYDPDEDRLVLWLHSGTADAPVSQVLHITRKVWVTSRLDLQAMVDVSAQAPEQVAAPVKRQISQAHHQALRAQADVQTDQPVPPAPKDAVRLVRHIRCGRRRSDGKWLLEFSLADDRMSLWLRDSTLHALAAAFAEQETRARWGLAPLAMAVKQPAPVSGSHLH